MLKHADQHADILDLRVSVDVHRPWETVFLPNRLQEQA